MERREPNLDLPEESMVPCFGVVCAAGKGRQYEEMICKGPGCKVYAAIVDHAEIRRTPPECPQYRDS